MLGYVRECSIAIIAIENYTPEAGDKQIRPAIIVVLADHRTHGPTGITDARFVGDVGEGPIVIIVVERAASLLARQRHLHALRVSEVNIRPAVAIIVDKSNAPAHRLHDVFLFRTREMFKLDASRSGNI